MVDSFNGEKCGVTFQLFDTGPTIGVIVAWDGALSLLDVPATRACLEALGQFAAIFSSGLRERGLIV